ncbi:MAG: SpoIIE family protein phosphatase [Clostridia bacterium]|nr:SpoIIE family protein phosphatase [Clostridia bacterium]
MFLVLTNARGYSVSPFSVGALFALMWCGLYLPVVAGEYLFANILLMNKSADIYSAITTVFVLLLAYLIHKKLKRPMSVVLVGLYALISQVVSLYYIYNIGGWLDCLIFAIVALVFLYVCISVFQVVVLRGWFYKLTLDETISLFTLITVLTFGVAEIYIKGVSICKLIAILLILISVGVNKKSFSIILSMAMGLGFAIINSSLVIVGEFVLIAGAVNIFAYPHKYKMCFMAIVGDLVLQLYFVGVCVDVIYNILPTLCAVVLFLCIPNRVVDRVADKYISTNAELSVRNVIGATRKSLKHRIGELGAVFEQMGQIHMQLVQKELGNSQIASLIGEEISKSLCVECKNKNYCHKGLGSGGININKLIEVGLKKGKITILDLPNSMTQKCGVINLVIGKINQLILSYQKYNLMQKDVNDVKFLLAEQMSAISQLLSNLGEDLDRNVDFDAKMHEKIINGLTANNVVCSEVLIYAERGQELTVVAIIKGDNAYNPEVEKVVSKSVKLDMAVIEVEPTDLADYYSIKLVPKCKRDIAFGITNITKTGSASSGDSHSLIRLGNNKYMLALCDGMGSGENARKMSALTMGLVENFYRAGFEDKYILSNVNKLISLSNQENFSTLDLCVIDLNKELIDFIKLGATYGVIKRENWVEKVETGTLPLGVLGQVKPSVSQFGVSHKDMIIMITDGITDAYGEYEEFANFVNGIVSTNPQVVAQTILDEALLRNGGIARDDMTVLVARTFLKE